MDDALRHMRQAAALTYLSQHSRLLSVGSNFRYLNDPETGRATIWVQLVMDEQTGYELSSTIPPAPHRALALIADARGEFDILISGGETEEEAERNLADIIADQVEEEVGHRGMARMILQLRRWGPEAMLDPEVDELEAREVGEAPAPRRGIHELAALSSAEAGIDQLEAFLSDRVARLGEIYARILTGAPAEIVQEVRADVEAVAPDWQLLIEGENLPDTGISALERGALRERFTIVSGRIDQCEVISKIFDAALSRLIEQQTEGDQPTNQ